MKAKLDNMDESLTDQLDRFDDEPANGDVFGTTTVIPTEIPLLTSADSRAQIGSVLRDRFLLKEKVSGGSMGVVYKALDRRLAEAEADDPWVAIKVLSPQLARNGHALRALQQEAAKGRCLVHPHIVRFVDMDRDDDLYFIVMEWLEGRTLADILDSSEARAIDKDIAFRIVYQIGEALGYAHRCGIVHADVKPANIMLMLNGNAKLFDFGIARVQQQSERDFDPATLGALTPAYSSMQVLTGEEPVPADDVFSLGCLLYRLLAGHRVFGPRNAAEASSQGMKPQRPQGLSDAKWSALKKALSYSRVMRFSSVDQFTAALRGDIEVDEVDEAAAVDEVVAVEVPPRAEHEKEFRSGSAGKWIIALFILLGLAGGALYQAGLLKQWLPMLETWLPMAKTGTESAVVIERVDPTPVVEAPPVTIFETPPVAEPSEVVTETETETPVIEERPAEPIIDFSTLPAADLEVPFRLGKMSSTNFRLALREDARPVTVDFVRDNAIGVPLVLKLDEVGFSGNRSPWASRQYALSNGGILRFPAGQDRSRITLTMASDPLREADQLSTLRLREADSAESELAIIYVTLEDDDQRAFEAQLPVNTIAFAASQASVRESDPAVQIDIVRFNPDSSRATIEFVVSDVTATEGLDYFAPANTRISFGPGQRSARLLIPLVQDSLVEGDEAFMIELTTDADAKTDSVYHRLVVMIRDDEPQ